MAKTLSMVRVEQRRRPASWRCSGARPESSTSAVGGAPGRGAPTPAVPVGDAGNAGSGGGAGATGAAGASGAGGASAAARARAAARGAEVGGAGGRDDGRRRRDGRRGRRDDRGARPAPRARPRRRRVHRGHARTSRRVGRGRLLASFPGRHRRRRASGLLAGSGARRRDDLGSSAADDARVDLLEGTSAANFPSRSAGARGICVPYVGRRELGGGIEAGWRSRDRGVDGGGPAAVHLLDGHDAPAPEQRQLSVPERRREPRRGARDRDEPRALRRRARPRQFDPSAAHDVRAGLLDRRRGAVQARPAARVGGQGGLDPRDGARRGAARVRVQRARARRLGVTQHDPRVRRQRVHAVVRGQRRDRGAVHAVLRGLRDLRPRRRARGERAAPRALLRGRGPLRGPRLRRALRGAPRDRRPRPRAGDAVPRPPHATLRRDHGPDDDGGARARDDHVRAQHPAYGDLAGREHEGRPASTRRDDQEVRDVVHPPRGRGGDAAGAPVPGDRRAGARLRPRVCSWSAPAARAGRRARLHRGDRHGRLLPAHVLRRAPLRDLLRRARMFLPAPPAAAAARPSRPSSRSRRAPRSRAASSRWPASPPTRCAVR